MLRLAHGCGTLQTLILVALTFSDNVEKVWGHLSITLHDRYRHSNLFFFFFDQ